MKRLMLLIGIVDALTGVAILLPAMANYGRTGPMAHSATIALFSGGILVLSGVGMVIYAARRRKDHAT